MARRHVHYEAAFEDYLRSRGLPYIAVNEQRKAIFAGQRVKSFDFLVYRAPGDTWLVDIKGRKFPYDTGDGRRRYWENWVTREDLDGLTRWGAAFGEGFSPTFVFAYLLREPSPRQDIDFVHPYRDALYAFMCVSLDDYRQACRQRSPSWDTVSVPVSRFRSLVTPIQAA